MYSNNKKKQSKDFRKYQPGKSKQYSTSGLSQLFTDDFLSNWNWEGSQGKKPLKSFKLITTILFGK